jgi:drug/metabolite transporter (DMT)-like permease
MTRSYVPLVLLLSAIWGASFLFIKVAGRAFEPTTMMLLRTASTALLMASILVARDGLGATLSALRAAGIAAFAVGIVNAALPFTLIAWGEKHVDSGVAAIANSMVPIFVVLLAFWLRPSERVAGSRLAGVAVGFIGVAVLAGAQPEGGWWAVAGTLAVVIAALSYAFAALWTQHLVAGMSVPLLTVTTMGGAALVLLPFGIAQAPADVPGWKPVLSLAALSVLGTTLGSLIYFRLISGWGSAKATLVIYLLPVTALLYGAAFLDESLTVAKVGGLVLILLGVALGSGVVRLPRREVAAAAPRA